MKIVAIDWLLFHEYRNDYLAWKFPKKIFRRETIGNRETMKRLLYSLNSRWPWCSFNRRAIQRDTQNGKTFSTLLKFSHRGTQKQNLHKWATLTTKNQRNFVFPLQENKIWWKGNGLLEGCGINVEVQGGSKLRIPLNFQPHTEMLPEPDIYRLVFSSELVGVWKEKMVNKFMQRNLSIVKNLGMSTYVIAWKVMNIVIVKQKGFKKINRKEGNFNH